MRIFALLLGVLLLATGGAISFGLIEYDTQSTLAKIGPLEVKSTEKTQPDRRIGYLLLGVGAVSLIIGIVVGKK